MFSTSSTRMFKFLFLFDKKLIILYLTKPRSNQNQQHRKEGFRPCAEKLKSLGSSFPLGSLMPGSRSSSKNLCAHACKGVCLLPGVYSNNDDVNEIASAGVLALKT